MFIRFVTNDADNYRWATGIFASARILRDDGRLEDYQESVVEAAFTWFNENLPCPPFAENRRNGTWSANAVAWFDSKAREPISHMWDLVAGLKEQSVRVSMIRARYPGEIVYRDNHQIVAETPWRK
jgi:hypothetical protein